MLNYKFTKSKLFHKMFFLNGTKLYFSRYMRIFPRMGHVM